MLTTDLIEHVLTTIPNRTVGLLGDLFLDRYLDIDPALDEPSIETGLTAYQVTRVRSYPGALGTVLNNLSALGVGRIYPIAVIGDDGEGYELRQALTRLPGVEFGGLVTAPDRRTPTYTKPMRGSEELNRLDIKNRTPTPTAWEDMVLDLLAEAWPQLDALIVLDQVSEEACGVVTKHVREQLAEFGAQWPDKFVLADSRERIGLFRNVCVKPNRDELRRCLEEPLLSDGVQHVSALTGRSYEDAEFLLLVGGLMYKTGRIVFGTDGVNGIMLKPDVQNLYTPIIHVPAYRVTGPIDTVGAGDSCSAGIACGMVAGLTPEQAAAFGNLVASITIQQIGTTGTASPDQVRRRWREVSQNASGGG
jgi:bifunctional ADP-heptose synthase (sugar kinase/adenylyltransferase)